MKTGESDRPTAGRHRGKRLRKGFSTGTAMTAAARAALRCWLTGAPPDVIAVRLPAGWFLPVSIGECSLEGSGAIAVVVKDGGDDPDVTHGAEIRVRVHGALHAPGSGAQDSTSGNGATSCGGIWIVGGEGVGTVTKAGLPVAIGEPAINPIPREMLLQNLAEELEALGRNHTFDAWNEHGLWQHNVLENTSGTASSRVFVPFSNGCSIRASLSQVLLAVHVDVPRGTELARHTLNPRLGILGGISILGTTGIVRPLSHEAYEETIQAALSVAASNGCREVVLSTGGKSEHFARKRLPGLSFEAFIQIADFFAFSVRSASAMGFEGLIHSAFFGKVVKMAQGHAYTHAHKAELDLSLLVGKARDLGYGDTLCRALAAANTARHALEILMEQSATDIVLSVARQALEQSASIAGTSMAVRLLLFGYDGTLLTDIQT